MLEARKTMIIKPKVVLGISLVLSMSGLASSSQQHGVADAKNVSALIFSQGNQDNDLQLDKLLHDLRLGNESERVAARTTLLDLSHKSSATRESLIKELLKTVKVPIKSVEFMRDPARYLEWKETTTLLGLLRAVEAIDALIECLDCNNGVFRLSADVFPATKAIIEIGDKSIPKLSQVIKRGSQLKRYLAVVALSQIGGDEAKAVLERAQQIEKDKEMALTISRLLANWTNSNKRK